MGYKIKEDNKNENINLWDAEAETLIALLSLRLERVRKKNKYKTCKSLNYHFLRKRKYIVNDKNYGATKLQRAILEQGGY